MCEAGVLGVVGRIQANGTEGLGLEWAKISGGRSSFDAGGVEIARTQCSKCPAAIPLVRQFWMQERLFVLGRAVHFAFNEGAAIALGHVDVDGTLKKETASIAGRSTEPLAGLWQGLFWGLFKTALLSVANGRVTEPFQPSRSWDRRAAPGDRDQIVTEVERQLKAARRRPDLPTKKSTELAAWLRDGALDLRKLGYIAQPGEEEVDGFHCTAKIDIVYRRPSDGCSIAVEIKIGEDGLWPPVYQPVAYLFGHDLVLHSRFSDVGRKRRASAPNPIRLSSAKAIRMLENTGRVQFFHL